MFLLIFFNRNDIKKYVFCWPWCVPPVLWIWQYCFNDPGRLLNVCTLVPPSAYCSYPAIYALLPWHVDQCVCKLICTHPHWSTTLFPRRAVWLPNFWLRSWEFTQPPRMFFSLSTVSFQAFPTFLSLSLPTQQRNQNANQERLWPRPESASDLSISAVELVITAL